MKIIPAARQDGSGSVDIRNRKSRCTVFRSGNKQQPEVEVYGFQEAEVTNNRKSRCTVTGSGSGHKPEVAKQEAETELAEVLYHKCNGWHTLRDEDHRK